MKELIRQELNQARETLERFTDNDSNLESIQEAAQLMIHALQEGGKIISCGNGGSMADAMHFAQELTGRYRDERPSIPAISISDPTHITCAGNDYGYDEIFSRFIEGVGNGGDVLLAISTSGNSRNIIRAAEVALEKGMKIVGLTGKTGGLLSKMATVNIHVEGGDYSDRAQEIHIKVIHILIHLIEKGVF